MDDDPSLIISLVVDASRGEEAAWRELVDRYSALLVAVIRRYRLTPSETEDVAQTVWLRLVEHLKDLREPNALPAWIMTTGRREAIRHLTARQRTILHDPRYDAHLFVADDAEDPDDRLERMERHEALLAGLAELPSKQRELLLLLTENPPLSYAEISSRIGIPVGGIGPTRARALERLRRTRPIKAYASGIEYTEDRGGGRHDSARLG